MPVGGAKPQFSTNTSGNDGGIGFKTGLRLARAAAMLYLRYASPLGALNAMQMMNMGGMGGFLNNPMMMQMQAGCRADWASAAAVSIALRARRCS